MRRRGLWILAAVCVLLAGADFAYEKHGHFAFEQWPAFHGLLGGLGSAALVLAALALRRALRREDEE